MIALRIHVGTLRAWLVVGLLVLFVGAPLADRLECGGDGLPAQHAAQMVTPELSQTSAAGHAGDVPGDVACVHGHCHHGGVTVIAEAAAAASAAPSRVTGLPPPSAELASAELSPSKPPPRA